MKYPKLLQIGDTIGVCAPSTGTGEAFYPRLQNAVKNVRALGYRVVETASVRGDEKCVSADAQTRAAEFMSLYENPAVSAILPPWGGEFLMEILPLLDFARLRALPPKWLCGYSDVSTLTFALTLGCDLATLHGSNLMNMGYARIHETDLRLFEALSQQTTVQQSAPHWGAYAGWDITGEIYDLTRENRWQALDGKTQHGFSGRILGGCMDTLCKLLGTRFAPVEVFLEKYAADGIVWTLESCEMGAPDIYRTLWQMRECGWFRHCSGILYGRPDGYAPKRDFALPDALHAALDSLRIPVIYDADIGHIPPQMQFINGALGQIAFADGRASVTQKKG